MTATHDQCKAAYDRGLADPLSITDRDVAIVTEVYGKDWGERFQQRREAAHKTVTPAATATPPAPQRAAAICLTQELADVIAEGIAHGCKLVKTELLGEISTLKKENAELRKEFAEFKQRAFMHERGVWKSGEMYEPGAFVTHQSSGWVCGRTHYSTGTDLDHTAFRLAIKRGRDGKDLR